MHFRLKQLLQSLVLSSGRVPFIGRFYKAVYYFAFTIIRAAVALISLGRARLVKKDSLCKKEFIAGVSDIDLTIICDFRSPAQEYFFLKAFKKLYQPMRMLAPFLEPFAAIGINSRRDAVASCSGYGRIILERMTKKQPLSVPGYFFLDEQFESIPEKYLLMPLLFSRKSCASTAVRIVRKQADYLEGRGKYIERLENEPFLPFCCIASPAAQRLQSVLRDRKFIQPVSREYLQLIYEAFRAKFSFHSLLSQRLSAKLSFLQDYSDADAISFPGQRTGELIRKKIACVKNVLFYAVPFSQNAVMNVIIDAELLDEGFFIDLCNLLTETGDAGRFRRFNRIRIDTQESLGNRVWFGAEETPFFLKHLRAHHITVSSAGDACVPHVPTLALRCLERLLSSITVGLRNAAMLQYGTPGRLAASSEWLELLAIRHWLESAEQIVDPLGLKEHFMASGPFMQAFLNGLLKDKAGNYAGLCEQLVYFSLPRLVQMTPLGLTAASCQGADEIRSLLHPVPVQGPYLACVRD